MRRLTLAFAVLAVIFDGVCGSAHPAVAMVIAACGFNDAVGINSDSTPNSPYKLNDTVNGYGTTEPGWGGSTWSTDPSPAHATTVTTSPYEGDGCMELAPANSLGETSWITSTVGNASVLLLLYRAGGAIPSQC